MCSSLRSTAHRDLLYTSKRYSHRRTDRTKAQEQIWFRRKNIYQNTEKEREECDRKRWCRNGFYRKDCDVENYLNICNDTQADLFNKIKTLLLIDYWTLSVKWLIIIRDFLHKNSVKTLSRPWQDFDKSLFNEILINFISKSRQGSNQSWFKISTRSRSILIQDLDKISINLDLKFRRDLN